MKRFALIIMTIATIFVQQAHAQYYSVNFDAKTVAAMVAAYGTGTVAEAYYDEQVQAILKHYKASEVATAGIFASKFLERRALTDLGIWSSTTENYYYRRIYHLVAHKSRKTKRDGCEKRNAFIETKTKCASNLIRKVTAYLQNQSKTPSLYIKINGIQMDF